MEALLDRAGAAPQIYDIGWLMNLISASGNNIATLTAEQFNEIKAAADAHKTFMGYGEVYSSDISNDGSNTYILLGRLSSGYVITLVVSLLNGTYKAGLRTERIVTQDDLTDYAKASDLTDYAKVSDLTGFAKASDVPTKTSQLTNDSGFITADDVTMLGKTVVKTNESTIGYGTSYVASMPSIELAADKFNIVGRCSGLTLTLPAVADMDGQEYCCQFYVPDSQYTLTVPADVRWQNGEVPTFEGNTCCQLVIVNNCATIGVFKASS